MFGIGPTPISHCVRSSGRRLLDLLGVLRHTGKRRDVLLWEDDPLVFQIAHQLQGELADAGTLSPLSLRRGP